MKIKVCDVVRNSIWYDPRVIKQIKEYSKHGFEIYAVGEEDCRYNLSEINKIPADVRLVKTIGKFARFQNKLNTFLKEIYIYRSLVKEIVKCNPDIIHANDLNALLPAYFAAKKMGCKLIYDSHEIFVENIGIVNSFVKRSLWSFIEKRLIKKIDLLVCVSHAAAEYLSNLYQIKDTMVVTNCAFKQHNLESVEKSLNFEVLNHGQFYEGRGYELMTQAAVLTTIPNVKYVLRGFGRLEMSLRDFVSDNSVANVDFSPPVKTTELIKYARKSHVGVAITLPINLNFKLSVSNKIFEYVAAGLPVIMSDIPEHRLLNEKYDFGVILKEHTPQALAEAVALLHDNIELYNHYAQNARAMAKETNWETEFEKLIRYEKNLMQ